MNYQILLVENRESVLNLFQQIRWGDEFTIDSCMSGNEALEWLKDNSAHLIYVGDILPDMDCVEFLYQKKRISRAEMIPVVVLSELEDYRQRVAHLEEGFDDYFLVPFEPSEVQARGRILLREVFQPLLSPAQGTRGFSGNLSEMNLVDLLQTLELGKKSGIIHLKQAMRDARVFLKAGSVIDAEADGKIGEDAIYSLFTWDDGVFSVEFGEIDREPNIRLSTQDIMFRGLKIYEEWMALRREFPNRNIIFQRNEISREEELKPEWQEVLALIDGKRNLRRLLEISRFNELETLSILRQLKVIGLILAEGETTEEPSFLEKELLEQRYAVISEEHLKNVIDFYSACLLRKRSFEKQLEAIYPVRLQLPEKGKLTSHHRLEKMDLQYMKRKLL